MFFTNSITVTVTVFALVVMLLLIPTCSSVCMESKSQSNEEENMIKHFFTNMKNGTYVEIGALNGIRLSNTLKLHTCYDWNGVLVEGMKRNFDELEVNVKTTRPNVQIHYGAVCTPPKTFVSFLVSKDPSYTAIGGDTEQMSRAFKNRWHGDNSVEEKSPCKPMSYYLAGTSLVNFFSLDVEGAELEVLHTMDFRKTKVDLFMIELDNHNPERNYRIRQLLFNMNYVECVGVVARSAVFLSGNPSREYKCPKGTNIAPHPLEAPDV